MPALSKNPGFRREIRRIDRLRHPRYNEMEDGRPRRGTNRRKGRGRTGEKAMKKAWKIAAWVVLVLALIWVFGRYGWKLFGFYACQTAGISCVEVADDQVRITGCAPGTFPGGFLGYHSAEEDGTLYVGFRHSDLFGIFEVSDFDIVIPVQGEIKAVVMKSRSNEYIIWPQAEE